jgi:hypothetical protein
VTHCFRYPALLRYQLSSLVLWQPPPEVHVTMTVFYTEEDQDTKELLEWFGNLHLPNVVWKWWPLPVLQLCRRSIGRNLAAQASQADWVWFTDADYWFARRCWLMFPEPSAIDHPLIYPVTIRKHQSHALGDQAVERARPAEGLVRLSPREFIACRIRRAIGGVQIVKGDWCRAHGYLPDNRKAQKPAQSAAFTRCRQDRVFRKALGSAGLPVKLPGVYRIRHSKAGRHHPGLCL